MAALWLQNKTLCTCPQVLIRRLLRAGLDTGVLLLRNTDWSRALLDDALAFMTDEAKQVRLTMASLAARSSWLAASRISLDQHICS